MGFLSYVAVFFIGICVGFIVAHIFQFLDEEYEEDDDWDHHDHLEDEEDPEEDFL